ncbi:MAG: DUF6476 family protein [Paracoccaceae bacterium]
MSDPDPTDPALPEPANLRFLRILVTTLTAVMICGLLVIVTLLVMRFSSDPVPQLPERVELPEGTRALAITAARDWYAIVTDDDRILIYDQASGALRQTLIVERGE